MRYRQILTCLFLLAFMPLSAKALPPPSPAGGNYLALDGVDDYAVLDFEAFGLLLPEGTNEFTIDAWIYPTTPPDQDTAGIIFHQQARTLIVNDEYQPWLNNLANGLNIKPPQEDFILLMSAYIEGKSSQRRLLFPVPLEPNQWHHIAYQSNGLQTTMIVNDFVKTIQQNFPLGHAAWFPIKDFVLGGFGKRIRIPVKEVRFSDLFGGYIDEVRIPYLYRKSYGNSNRIWRCSKNSNNMPWNPERKFSIEVKFALKVDTNKTSFCDFQFGSLHSRHRSLSEPQ